MTSRDFCFWLQGYLEISDAVVDGTGPFSSTTLTEGQMKCVRNHLALVFKHEIDPSMGNQQHQDDLNKIHGQSVPGGKPSDVLIRC